MSRDIAIRPYHAGDEDGILALLREVFPDNTRWVPEWWEWRHRKNPAGNSMILVAEEDGEIIGHHSNLPFEAMYFGQFVKVGMGTELAIREAFRGKGIYRRMMEEEYRLSRRNGWSFLINFPNSNSTAGLLKYGFLKVHDYLPWAKLLNPSRASDILGSAADPGLALTIQAFNRIHRSALTLMSTKKRAKGLDVIEDELFDSSYDVFWESVAGSYSIAVIRDTSYLNWRYVLNPTRRYDRRYAYRIISARTGGRIAGFCVLSCTYGRTYNTGNIIEFLVLPGFGEAVKALLERVNALFQEEGMDIIVFRLQRSDFFKSAFYRNGFLPVPLRRDLFAVYPLQVNINARMLQQKRNWLLRPGDIGSF